ncbi:MAG TPA: hypothetical protein VN732_06720, partial [Solirubrobacterales bacterium]|nr:hypothetical protein [Solirubrobacterales bacterium]
MAMAEPRFQRDGSGNIRLALAIALMVLGSLIFSGQAAAADTHGYIGAFGPDGTEGTSFERPGAIGLDEASGDVYVADTVRKSVYKFGPNGESRAFSTLGTNELGGFQFFATEPVQIAVNPTTHVFYVADLGAGAVKAYDADGEAAEFTATGSNQLTASGQICGVAVDPAGAIYVGAWGFSGPGVSIFTPAGELITSFAVDGICNVAVDSDGTVYVNRYHGAVERFDPSEFPVTNATTYSGGGTVDSNESFGVAVDPATDDLYVDEGDRIIQYSPTGVRQGESGNSGEGAVRESEGVAVQGSSGLLFAADLATNRVKRYGPLEPAPPEVGQSWVSEVNSTEATLNARVNPNGEQTSYRFEYGTADCASAPCEATVPTAIGAGGSLLRVSARIAGLLPGTAYFFRVRAFNAEAEEAGPVSSFRTRRPLESALPDGRAFEMVSPALNKNSAELGLPKAASGGSSGLLDSSAVNPQRAASHGDAVVYSSFTAFDDPVGAPAASYYLSRRTSSGWTTENITPPDRPLGLTGPLQGLTDDLGHAGMVVTGDVMAPGAVPGYQNLYLLDNATGEVRAITTRVPTHIDARYFCVNYIGSSADGSRVFLAANGGLTADTPPPSESGGISLYEWTAGEGLK